MFGLVFKSEVNCMKHPSLKYLWVVRYHQCDLINFIFIFRLINLDLVKSIGSLKNPLLHRTKYLLNNLPNLGLHLEPFEFLDLEFLILCHINKFNSLNYYKLFILLISYHNHPHLLILLRSSFIVFIKMFMYWALLTVSSTILS